MSQPLSRLAANMPLTTYVVNDNTDCQERNVVQQQGSGVVNGMALSAGALLVLNIAPGYVQNRRTVPYAGGSATVPDSSTNYVMADWVSSVDTGTGMTIYTFSFSFQAGSTPPGGQVCIGRVTASGGSITEVSTDGLFVLPHVSGSSFIIGQNRIVVDDSTGETSIQSVQGFLASKDHLVSGDSISVSSGHQVALFDSFTIDAGALFSCSGKLRITT